MTFKVGLGQKINICTTYDYQYDKKLKHNYFAAISSITSNLSGFTMGTVSWNQTSCTSNIGSNKDRPSFNITVYGVYSAYVFVQSVGNIYTSKPIKYSYTTAFRP